MIDVGIESIFADISFGMILATMILFVLLVYFLTHDGDDEK